MSNYNEEVVSEILQPQKYEKINICLDTDNRYFTRNKLNNELFYTKHRKPRLKLQTIDLKPSGLWYSCGIEWYVYFRDNFVQKEGELKKSVKKLIIDCSKIKMITTYEELLSFHKKYRIRKKMDTYYTFIDWKRVQKEYYGIQICPCLRNLIPFSKKSLMWYYSWDIASGCIWNPDAILKIEKGGSITFNQKSLQNNRCDKKFKKIIDKWL